jgi:hypothetical protein
MLVLRLMLVIGVCGMVATLVGVVRDIRESFELARLMRPVAREARVDDADRARDVR